MVDAGGSHRWPTVATDKAELLAHVDWVAPGYEIVECHFPDRTFRTADAVADFGVHGALSTSR